MTLSLAVLAANVWFIMILLIDDVQLALDALCTFLVTYVLVHLNQVHHIFYK